MHVVTRPVTIAATLTILFGWTLPADAQLSDADRYWGQWRGPEATGVSRHADPAADVERGSSTSPGRWRSPGAAWRRR